MIERQLLTQEIGSLQRVSDHKGLNDKFSKNCFKLFQSLTDLLQKHTRFRFDESSFIAYKVLRQALVNAHFIGQFIKELPLNIILEERDKLDRDIQCGNTGFNVLQHTLSTPNKIHDNYFMTDKQLLAVTFISERFKPHVIDSKIKVYINYGGLKKIIWKTMNKNKIIYWVILLQEPKLQVVQRRKKPPDELGGFVSIGHTSTTNASPKSVHHPSLGENLAPVIKIIEETRGLEWVFSYILRFDLCSEFSSSFFISLHFFALIEWSNKPVRVGGMVTLLMM